MNVTVYDFTGIYENESFDFYKKEGARSLFNEIEKASETEGTSGDEASRGNYISLRDISGTNCICDDYACAEIKKRIADGCPDSGADFKDADDLKGSPRISFFDNGNYHYMSKLLMDDLCERASFLSEGVGQQGGAFDLVVFDHHPDMKWTSYGEVLSCGSWVLNALKDRKELRQVFIIGADKKLMEEAYSDNPEINGRVSYFEDFKAFQRMLESSGKDEAKKLYISVDKDVLSEDELSTNWDQGEMTLEELRDGLSFLKSCYGDNIVAVDVCGECTVDSPESFTEKGFEASNKINSMIMSVFS